MATLIENKKVRFNYEILETLEAGIKLFGHEVKSLRNKHGSLEGAHVIVRGDEAFMAGATIPPYQPSNMKDVYDPMRVRKLLLGKSQIRELIGKEKQKGLTIVPTVVYTKGRNLKLGIAVVRGKKKFDKRQSIRKREDERNVQRTLKGE